MPTATATATKPTTRDTAREVAIRQLENILNVPAATIAAMPVERRAWDRRRDDDWATRQLARLGVK